ncbi:MAG TPA: M28 family peptidase, partial [Kofleriaceae bacterium]|nr:M28 family peptidase [Kofleriaceae bacterium]
STALFATDPVAIDLYNKPLARNSQVWNEHYQLVLDGPRATQEQILHAAALVDAGGRFGYRMYYPPMRAGVRELFWHVPVVAASGRGRLRDALPGYVTAELAGAQPLVLSPHFLQRPEHVAAARLFQRDPGHVRHTTCQNVRKLLEAKELFGGPIAPAYARSLLHIPKTQTVDAWFDELAGHASDRAAGDKLVATLRKCVAKEDDPQLPPHVMAEMGTRAVEEQIWSTIAHLAHGEFIQKSNGDGITVNRGKHGGKAAQAAHIHVHDRNDLVALGDHLHARYRDLIAAAGMNGKAEVVDHVFRWETDFAFPWMEGWAANADKPAERNIVMMIPGKRRDQAVVMGDHYDTAYMEDVYYEESGGDLLRAPAAGADDNHSATTALLLAAERLLPLAKAGKLERDVWLIHLTGEEYPADCMGARALCQALVERRLAFTAEDGSTRDVAQVDVVGAFVLDMVGHNTERDRDVFQIAPGEGTGSAKLARRALRANLAWNALAKQWNKDRHGQHRAERMPDVPNDRKHPPPPPFAHLALHGEVRVEWEPRSALFNTDGQIFSDLGIPVVLFMENYDISRKGYHDTHDTMANIDLDYCTAIIAIAIETVADTACARDL